MVLHVIGTPAVTPVVSVQSCCCILLPSFLWRSSAQSSSFTWNHRVLTQIEVPGGGFEMVSPPKLGRAAGFPRQAPILDFTSSIVLAQSLCSSLTLGLVGPSPCLHWDRISDKHCVKERRCLMELADSSDRRIVYFFKQAIGAAENPPIFWVTRLLSVYQHRIYCDQMFFSFDKTVSL